MLLPPSFTHRNLFSYTYLIVWAQLKDLYVLRYMYLGMIDSFEYIKQWKLIWFAYEVIHMLNSNIHASTNKIHEVRKEKEGISS